jgi:hypothetical protein
MKLAVLVVCVLAGTASAQAPNPNQAEADRFFEEGRDLLVNKKDAKGACEKFEKAIGLDPTAPGVMLNLGLCYEMQGKFATSLHWFRKAQFAAAEAKPPLPEYEEAAKTHTQDLAGKVALAKIDVSKAPPDVRVSIDGRPVRAEDYLRVEVDRDSRIEARAAGKDPFRQTVVVTGRDAQDIVIVMRDEIIPPMRDPGKGRRRLAYVVGATGAVICGLSLVYGLVVRSRYDDKTDGHYDGGGGYERAQDDMRLYGTGIFVIGAATVGGAVALWLTAPKPYREKPQQAFAPIVTPDGLGFSYARSF